MYKWIERCSINNRCQHVNVNIFIQMLTVVQWVSGDLSAAVSWFVGWSCPRGWWGETGCCGSATRWQQLDQFVLAVLPSL